jgi:hypothetical protein
LSNLQSAASRIGATNGSHNAQISQALRKAVGPQAVRLFALPADTHFAFVCIEADFLMKRLALGLQRSPLPALKSHLSMMKSGESAYSRWWFVASYEPLRTTEDGAAFEIRGQSLKVKAADSPDNDARPGAPSAQKFADLLSANMPALAEKLPAFADLCNLSDLGLVAAIMRHEKLAERCRWDLDWVLDRKNGYPVPEHPTPRQVETLANHKSNGSNLSVAVGGVVLDLSATASPGRRSHEGGDELSKLARRPARGEWLAKRAAD